jgi:hypothetical protein
MQISSVPLLCRWRGRAEGIFSRFAPGVEGALNHFSRFFLL